MAQFELMFRSPRFISVHALTKSNGTKLERRQYAQQWCPPEHTAVPAGAFFTSQTFMFAITPNDEVPPSYQLF